jgi:hypothetical protein
VLTIGDVEVVVGAGWREVWKNEFAWAGDLTRDRFPNLAVVKGAASRLHTSLLPRARRRICRQKL